MSSDAPLRVIPSTSDDAGAGVVKNVPGNSYDKHGSRNPIVNRLMTRFHEAVVSALACFEPESVLDVGCGEGRTTRVISDAVQVRTVGVDLEEVVLAEAKQNVPSAEFSTASVFDLPFGTSTFDVVIATEMLEHVDDPLGALAEMHRVASMAVIFTVPHEPWWRIANMARGKYVRDLGNTPGHVQHWSVRSLRSMLGSAGYSSSVQAVGLWSLATVAVSE